MFLFFFDYINLWAKAFSPKLIFSEENMGPFSKPWSELTIADNFIFCKVMENERICKGVLETLLGIRVDRIDYLKTENPLENFYDSHGIRLDVYVKVF